MRSGRGTRQGRVSLKGGRSLVGRGRLSVGTHYCLAVGNDEGLELDETGEDEELGEVDEEEA